MTTETSAHPLETAATGATRWVLAGAAASLLGLAIPPPTTTDGRLLLVIGHLGLVVAVGIAFVHRFGPLADRPFFGRHGVGTRLIASWASLVALTTGVVALITLPSSAALRYPASLQFLQLLSALDIAWAAAALYLGTRRMGGNRWALGAAAALGVFCLWSIWNYLRVVGFDAEGGWLVDGPRIVTLILPFDMVAAAVAVVTVVIAARSGRHVA